MARIENTVSVSYVMEIKIQQITRYIDSVPGSPSMPRATEVEKRDVSERAHYVVKEKVMKVLLDKGQKLLELSGE